METLSLQIGAVLLLGILAQWLAWMYRFPVIVLLLVAGFLAGPVTGLLRPEVLDGDLLFSFVSVSVAIILYEGGLSLRFKEIPGVRGVIFGLISVGLVATWIICTYGARVLLGLDLSLAVLLGAILTVSGPTVVLPLLRHVRPKAPLGEILKWEGILVDPIGALIAVLVFETLLEGALQRAPSHIVLGILHTIVVGGAAGTLGATLLIALIRRHLIPDYLEASFSLMVAISIYVISNYFRAESGLLAVTLLGIYLANASSISIRHIVEFKENLRVILISVLFILLAARVQLSDLETLNPFGTMAFLLVVIFVARPVSVLISTAGSGLSWSERAFIAWIAPRGIVAAAVSSLFALELSHKAGFESAHLLMPYTFIVIVGTVLVYGLTAGQVAKFLNVLQRSTEGILILGAHPVARAIGSELQQNGFVVLLVDTNSRNVSLASLEGLAAEKMNILSADALEHLDFDGLGRFLAMTPNTEANSLAALRLSEIFSRSEVYQLAEPGDKPSVAKGDIPKHLRGRTLFGEKLNYFELERLLRGGAHLKTTGITEEFNFEKYQEHYEGKAIPLFLIPEEGKIEIVTPEKTILPKAGSKVVSLILEG